jgi:hypothetical protein
MNESAFFYRYKFVPCGFRRDLFGFSFGLGLRIADYAIPVVIPNHHHHHDYDYHCGGRMMMAW